VGCKNLERIDRADSRREQAPQNVPVVGHSISLTRTANRLTADHFKKTPSPLAGEGYGGLANVVTLGSKEAESEVG
jgi:hypothetical protein